MSDPTRPEPSTAAGRKLFTDNEPMDMWESDGVTWEDILAIEAEARPTVSDLLDAAERTATASFKNGHASEAWWQGAVATVEWMRGNLAALDHAAAASAPKRQEHSYVLPGPDIFAEEPPE